MYQGHRNRVHWNVAYYLFNDYELYSMVKNEVKQAKNFDIATKNIFKRVPEKTSDGYKYSLSAIRYQTMCAMYICFSTFMMN